MIKNEMITSYKLTARFDDSEGFMYGPSHISLVKGENHFAPHWWAACVHCKRVALVTWSEISYFKECASCWELTGTGDYTIDRRLLPLDHHQQALTSAYLLGGLDGVQAAVDPIITRWQDVIKREDERLKALRP